MIGGLFEFGSRKEEKKQAPKSQEQTFEIAPIEFHNRVNYLHDLVLKLFEDYRELDKLTYGGKDINREKEDMRARKLADFYERLNIALTEVETLLKATEGQKMSVFTSRIQELATKRNEIKQLFSKRISIYKESIDRAA